MTSTLSLSQTVIKPTTVVDKSYFPSELTSDPDDYFRYDPQTGKWMFRIYNRQGTAHTYDFVCEFGTRAFKQEIMNLLINVAMRLLPDCEFKLLCFLVARLCNYGQTTYYFRDREICDGTLDSNLGGGANNHHTLKKAYRGLSGKSIIRVWKNDTGKLKVGRSYESKYYAIDYEGLNNFLKQAAKEHKMIRFSSDKEKGQKNFAKNHMENDSVSYVEDMENYSNHKEQLNIPNSDKYISSPVGSVIAEDVDVETLPVSIDGSITPPDCAAPPQYLSPQAAKEKIEQITLLNTSEKSLQLQSDNRAKAKARVRLTPQREINTNDLIQMFHEQARSEYEFYTATSFTIRDRGFWKKKIKDTKFPENKTMLDFIEYTINNWILIRDSYFQYWLCHLEPEAQAKNAYPSTPSIHYVAANFKVFLNSYVKFLSEGLDHSKLREKMRAAGYSREEIDEAIKKSAIKDEQQKDDSKALEKLKRETDAEIIRLQRETDAMKSQAKRRMEVVAEREAEVRRRELELNNVIPITAKKVYSNEDLKDLSKEYDARFSVQYGVDPGDAQRLLNIFRALKVHGVGNCENIIEGIYKFS